MKAEFKQACELEGQKFGPDMRKKPGVFDVPGYFVFLEYFVALLKEDKVKILDVSDEDFQEENVPERFHSVEPDALVTTILEKIMMSKEPKEQATDEEDHTSDSNGDLGSDSETIEQSNEEDHTSEDEKEFAVLHEKAKRLNRNEKKRYEELKAKLKGE